MRIIALLVMVFGVALGGGAIYFASKHFADLKASMAQQDRQPDTVRVLVAKQQLSYGQALEAQHLQWVEWPKAAVPAGAFTSVEELLGKGGQKRLVTRTIEPGEPVLQAKITNFGESNRMAMNLREGMRAVSIRINAVTGVSGFVAPGDRVDIQLIRTQGEQLTSSIILRDITVIAVDQRANSEAGSPRLGSTITVEVDTVQAQKLAIAQSLGSLSLILRGVDDADTAPVQPVTEESLSDLFEGPKAAKPTVRVRRGVNSVQNVRIGEETDSGDPTQDQSGTGQGGSGQTTPSN